MEKARQARYELMADYCNRNHIQILCIAHHADDQIETFFFRLSKGSGLDGLTGMQEWTDYNDNLKIYRPLLTKTHNDLIDYCKKHGLNWIEDPSNLDESYARPRLRKALIEEGFDAHRFTKTLKRISRAQDALDTIANSLIKDYSKLDFQMLKTYPLDIQIRVLQKCLSHIGDATHAYPPKLERVEEIVQTIQPSKSATLYGCLITCSKDGNTLEIKRS
jgi:tRNA(Ile)-lysidine synthase